MITVWHHPSLPMYLPIPLAIFKHKQFGKGKCPREDLKNMSYGTQWEFWLEIANTKNTLTISPFGNFGTIPFTTLMSTSIPYPTLIQGTYSSSQTRHYQPKDENIGNDEYIDTSILRIYQIYQRYIGGYFDIKYRWT